MPTPVSTAPDAVEQDGPLAQARAMAAQAAKGLTHAQIGRTAGLGRTAVCKRLSLLTLPRDVQALGEREHLPFTTLLLLVELPTPADQRRICRQAAAHGWSTRRVEREVARALGRRPRPSRRRYPAGRHPDALALTERASDALSEAAGRPVLVRVLGRQRFEVSMAAETPEDLLALVGRLGADAADEF